MEYKHILIVLWICFNGFSFGDETVLLCYSECQNQIKVVPEGDLFCNNKCKLDQCNSGCESYLTAVNSSCLAVCSDSYKTDGTSLIRSLQQTERQYCTVGCSYAVNVFTQNIKNLLGELPAPELKKDTRGYSSLTLHWKGPINSNVTYYIQSRILDTNGDWLIYSGSSVQPNGDVLIQGLHPYITYKFRISLVISTSEVLYTPESENITTLPHGVPSSAPTITEISAPTSSVISLSWLPPTYTNGPLLCYRLNLEPLNNEDIHETSIEVPSNATSWTFRQLTSSQEYLVSISAWNQAGEGLKDTVNMTTPSSGNLSGDETPKLVLAENNKVILQDMTEVETRDPDTIDIGVSPTYVIKGIAVHIQKQIILCSDSEGKVHRVDMTDRKEINTVYPGLRNPGAMTIDWLHDYIYIVDGLMIKRCGLAIPTCIMATEMLPSEPNVIQVDPINGFLFFTQSSCLYAIDIGEITPTGPASQFLLVKNEVNAFSIDFNNMQLYFPNNALNTIMSSFLDGSGIADVRKDKVIKPNYHQITSIVYGNGVFYLTNGSKVLFEEYNKGQGKFFLNEMLLFGTHFSSLNVYQPTAQPHPVPHSPPQNVRALFTDKRVLIQWQGPRTLSYQGKGAWQTWFYEVSLFEDDATEKEILQKVAGIKLVIENLVPNTTYQVKVRAWSNRGSGPWSEVFIGRTLTLEASTAKVIVAATLPTGAIQPTGVLYEIDMYGEHRKKLSDLPSYDSQVIDLTWFDDKILLTSSRNKVFLYDRNTSKTNPTHITEAACVAYDWLGEKLYWSNPRLNVIRRSNVDGQNEEFVIQGNARHMAIDALQGRLYWVTMTTMEAAYLNGDDHVVYFSVPYFSGKHVISLTLNFDLRKVLWYVKSYERQELFMSDLLGNSITKDQLSVQPLGSFLSISPFSVLQYFSHRLFWQSEGGSIVVGDLECNYTSEIITEPISVFTVTHPSLRPYPEKTDRGSVKIVPTNIESVQCQGHWSIFNLTWQNAVINHGRVFYEVSVQMENGSILARQTTENWLELRGIPAYTKMAVTLRAYSYWGYGPVTTSAIHSPMSAPSKPLTPRVYITQHKESITSENSLAADFRWTLPEQLNGLITEFIVYSWDSGNEKIKNTTSVPLTARHFNLPCLKPSMTYFFQVSACTQAGCGSRSDLVSAQADAVNPVPKLLVVSSTQLTIVEEADNGGNNTFVLEPSVSPVTAIYLAQDNRMFWVNKNNVLMESKQQSEKKLLQITGQVSDMAIDWISRTLFIVDFDPLRSRSSITAYLLDQDFSFMLVSREGFINSIVSDPHTSTVVWTEMEIGGRHFVVNKVGPDGMVKQLLGQSRNKRETTICNCTSNYEPGSVLTVDHSQDLKMEVLFYDKTSQSIAAMDIDGCYCHPVVAKSDIDINGLPPDILTVDHSHVYWYRKAVGLLYMMDKHTHVIMSKVMADVKDLIAYGTHLQPLPSTECLDPTAYKGKVEMVHNTNQTITLKLDSVVWPAGCRGISHPNTKYTVYYKSGAGTQSCGPGGSGCLSESSYNNSITLQNLQPFTTYIVHGAVSNYYTEYLSEALSQPVMFQTLIGVPSKARNITATGYSPEEILVRWSQPEISNGPWEDLVYVIRWSTQTNKGLYEGEQEYNGSLSRSSFSKILSNLLPNHTYTIEVKTSNSERKFFSHSESVTVKTFEKPRNIVLLSSKENNMTVAWTSPSDGSAYRHKFQYKKCSYTTDGWNEKSFLNGPTKPYTTYNMTFGGLQPFTDYCFRLVIWYDEPYTWSGNPEFIFRTMSSIPETPDPPKVESLSNQAGYEVVWTEPNDNGAEISHYVLQYWDDNQQTWYEVFNGTTTRWIIDDGVIPSGKEYTFRVAAENSNGIGPFSSNSTPFTFIEMAKAADDSIAIVSITVSFLFVFFLVLILAVCYVIRRRDRKKRKPKQFLVRGPDTELAILRELPPTAVQQSNTLYAINIIPTDGDIAKLPHFRRDQLMLTKFLGSGAFGEVFEGIAKNILNDNSGETKVAVKTLRKSASDHEKEEFLKEAVLMSNFKHDHILSLLGVCLDNDPQFIILELMEGGDLLSYLRTSRGLSTNSTVLCLTDLVKICVHVARGCKYLEEMHFVHRDLAARNCLVSSKTPSEIVVKIGDFGLARDIYKNDYYRKEGEGLLPVRWMSPESLVDGVFTTQSDIWAFGVLMWEVLTFGQQPYQARTNIEVLHFIRSGGQLEQPENCPEELYVLMNSCWSYGPDERPTFSYILHQLEVFHEKCVTLLADYIVPVRTRPIDVDGYLSNNHNNRTNQRTTLSHGHDTNDDHQLYRKIHRATSFDSPEPCDASLEMQNSSDYLHPQTTGTPNYLQLIGEPVTRKSSQSSTHSVRQLSQSGSQNSLQEPRIRKTSQSNSRHSSTSSDIYGHVQFSGYSIVSVPEEIPSHSGMSDDERMSNQNNAFQSHSVMSNNNALVCQQNYEDILLNYDHVPAMNQILECNHPNLDCDYHVAGEHLNHNHDLSNIPITSFHHSSNHDSQHNKKHHNKNNSAHLQGNLNSSQSQICLGLNPDVNQPVNRLNPDVNQPVNRLNPDINQPVNHILHVMSDPSLQMDHVRQYCHSVSLNDDVLLNYDHVPPQIMSSIHDPRLNYDYPHSHLQCSSAEERLRFDNFINRKSHSAEERIYYNNKENILPKGLKTGNNNVKVDNENKNIIYKNMDLTDSMNYVDCNRNRGGKYGITQSPPLVVCDGNISKAVRYWATNNIPAHPIHVRGSKAQVYPGQDTLAATLV